MSPSTNPYRLARTVVPSAYRIFLTPDLEKFTFAGRVEIDIDIKESVERFTLNALDLELGAATVSSDGTSYRSLEHTMDETYQTATFVFDRELPTGPAILEIAFDGFLNDKLVGFYRSTYTDVHGVDHVIATTQFENTDARRAFPCWDEPAFKATFQVNLTVPSELKTYSNSPVQSDVDLGNGQRTVSFRPTMIMSSYLVAFVVGAFEESETIDVDGIPLRVITPIGKVHLSELALEAGAFALRFFGHYFDIRYPGEKLDMIAIPDFLQGAMENLGLVTYRENALLVDPATASHLEIARVAEVVHHELAHMWFGDLVTMEWWEGIWLNEAFATFMQLICTNAFRPEWRTWVSQVPFRDLALQVDGLNRTRPIEYEVISPDDTQGMFDVLTYEKGGSVLRMLEQYLGEEVFRDGIRLYLRKHSYANAKTTDLWDALEENSGVPVRNVMDTWILQGGVPLVTLAGTTVTQQPFHYLAKTKDSAIGEHWLVPLMTRSLNGGEPSRHLLDDAPLSVTDAAPILLNAGGSGVFRSRYASNETAAIAARLGDLTEMERATVFSDALAALLANAITWRDFLTLAQGLTDQNEPTPWETVAAGIDMVYRALNSEQRVVLRDQVRALFAPQLERLGWDATDEEGELTPQLRAVVISTLGVVGEDENVRAEAVKRFEADEMDGDLARAILRVVAVQDRPGDYETFLERYRAAPTPQEEMRYMLGLASFRDPEVSIDAVKRNLSEFRSQDVPLTLPPLLANVDNGPAVWRYVSEHWDEVLDKVPVQHMSRMASGAPTYVNDPAFADEVEAFHDAHPVMGGYPATAPQHMERMRVGLAFAEVIRQQF
ncbi:MAG: M1 family aminopeptidase [Acidimicrobiales bacterium]|jgi:aminopeptidase N